MVHVKTIRVARLSSACSILLRTVPAHMQLLMHAAQPVWPFTTKLDTHTTVSRAVPYHLDSISSEKSLDARANAP